MTPVITAVRMTGAGRNELPLLVLGPSLGASAVEVWSACAAAGLRDVFDVVAWDLPGQGHNVSVPEEPYSLADLARGVLAVVDDVLAQRDELGHPFAYAGLALGGAVGVQLLLDAPGRVASTVLLRTDVSGTDVPAYDLDPAEQPEEVAALIRRQVLGEEVAEDADGVRERLRAGLTALARAAVRDGLSEAEVQAVLGEVTAPAVAWTKHD